MRSHHPPPDLPLPTVKMDTLFLNQLYPAGGGKGAGGHAWCWMDALFLNPNCPLQVDALFLNPEKAAVKAEVEPLLNDMLDMVPGLTIVLTALSQVTVHGKSMFGWRAYLYSWGVHAMCLGYSLC